MRIPSRIAAAALFSMLIGCASAAQQEGWYGGVSIGVGTVKVERRDWDDGTLTGVALDNRATAYKILAAYRFTPMFSLEGSYLHFGDTNFSGFEPGTKPSLWKPGPVSGKAQAKGLGLEAVGELPIKRRYGVFAKAGLFVWNTTMLSNPTLSGGTLALSNELTQNDDGVRWLYGAGAEVRIYDRWHARVEWEHSTVGFAGTLERGVDFSSIGVTFDF